MSVKQSIILLNKLVEIVTGSLITIYGVASIFKVTKLFLTF
jgi:hypothetical protein